MRQWADQEPIVQLGAGTPLGKYKVGRLIGAGAMGTVYEAEHAETGSRVAIKVLDPRLAGASEASARFRFEGWITGRVRHPHVVDVLEVGDEGGHSYLVMELLSGQDLAARLERSGPIPAEETADILVPVCAAIAAAHGAGVTHRDLKPHNIFLSERDGAVHPKVLDFGIAISQGGETPAPEIRGTTKGVPALIGSPCYLAPEQVVSSRSAGPATDQYALGVIAYECLTGRRPFDGANLNAVLQAIAAGKAQPPSELRTGLPAGLERVVLRAMSRDPSDRFASVTELGGAVLPFSSAPVRAAWEGTFPSPRREAKTVFMPSGPSPDAEPRWSSADLRARLGAAARRSPSSPSIAAEAATPSPFVRTLPPGVPELSEVSEPSLVPAVTLDLREDRETSAAIYESGRRSDRLAPIFRNRWVRSAGVAIALGGVALFVARGGSRGPKPEELLPASSHTMAPELPVERPAAPAPTAPPPSREPEAVEPEATAPAVAAGPLPAEAPGRGAESAPAAEPVPPVGIGSIENAAPSAKTEPSSDLARAASTAKGAAKAQTKAAKEIGARRKRRVPLLD